MTIKPAGARHGVYCRYVGEWDGCRIAIVDNPAPSDHRLSVHLDIGSIPLMRSGLAEVWASLLSLLGSLGYVHDRDLVGRADYCVDLPGVSMETVQAAVDARAVICKSGAETQFKNFGKTSTLYIGSLGSPLLMRIYDKLAEVAKDPVKLALLIDRRWGHLPEQAVRVEFQVRSKTLRRQFNIRSVAELIEDQAVTCEYLTHDWVRMVGEFDRKNKHHQRAELLPFWHEVQQAFRSWTGEPGRRRRKRYTVPDPAALDQQVFGCLAKKLAMVHAFDERDETDVERAFLVEIDRLKFEGIQKIRAKVDEKLRTMIAQARGPAANDEDIPF